MTRPTLPRFAALRSQNEIDLADRRDRAAAFTARVVNAVILLVCFSVLAYLGAHLLAALPDLLRLGDIAK